MSVYDLALPEERVVFGPCSLFSGLGSFGRGETGDFFSLISSYLVYFPALALVLLLHQAEPEFLCRSMISTSILILIYATV